MTRPALTVALVLALVLTPAAAFAQEAKPPACEKGTKGVIWNYGTESKPDFRRCDGISYVPYAALCGPGAAAATGAPAAGGEPKTERQVCNATCEDARNLCASRCGSVFDTSCKPRCDRERLSCMKKCP